MPSRVLIIINSFFIIPIFTYALNHKEVSIYLIALQVLNLICTCSFDWISKAVLRFYEKYKLQNKLEEFFSTIFWLSAIVYTFALILYFLFKDILITKFAITNLIFVLTIVLVIPCGIRQTLYQILRINNEHWLYTLSIILYQFIFIAAFLGLVNIIHNAAAIIIAMTFAIITIDIYTTGKIHTKYKVQFVINKDIILETLKYSLPLVITNILYWLVLYLPNFIFQSTGSYMKTSVFGISFALVSNTIQPLAGLFSFVNYPVLIKNFEHNKKIKPYLTNSIQLYFFILFPIVLGFCFFSENIVKIVLPGDYSIAAFLMPFFAFKLFTHELLKLITIKFHLINKTYWEMLTAIFIISIFSFINLKYAGILPIIFVAIIMFLTELLLLIFNIFIKFKDADYINYKKVITTTALILAVACICAFAVKVFLQYDNVLISALSIVIYLVMSYGILYSFRKAVLI